MSPGLAGVLNRGTIRRREQRPIRVCAGARALRRVGECDADALRNAASVGGHAAGPVFSAPTWQTASTRSDSPGAAVFNGSPQTAPDPYCCTLMNAFGGDDTPFTVATTAAS